MAEGFAKALAGELLDAHSAGSNPSGKVNDRAIQFMREVNIDLSGHHSKSVNDFDPAIKWDYVITMGCGDSCPTISAAHRLDWQLQNPKDLSDCEFRKVRDEVLARIQDLLKELLIRRVKCAISERPLRK